MNQKAIELEAREAFEEWASKAPRFPDKNKRNDAKSWYMAGFIQAFNEFEGRIKSIESAMPRIFESQDGKILRWDCPTEELPESCFIEE